ncbi:unnamed protein product [Cylicocyclus nassatus]|uniref:Uncharacterized protein n=1 Tax=Cylicocyclus nassatus TaxID=53992 RepID=A0AA36DQS7_CYLNA|nr:unnamed protein product [Cylicocyclus nassatus]
MIGYVDCFDLLICNETSQVPELYDNGGKRDKCVGQCSGASKWCVGYKDKKNTEESPIDDAREKRMSTSIQGRDGNMAVVQATST